VPTSGAIPSSIAAGPDGALWFTEVVANKIGRITTGGAITEFPLPATLNGPTGIVRGPDGALWFWDNVNGRIGRITTSGVVTSFPIPNLIVDLTVGPDGSTVVYRRGELRDRANYRWWRHH
jgi:virginiamycin B lyase